MKLIKSKNSKYDPTIVDFDNIDVCEVRYLPSPIDDDMYFVLPLVAMGVPSAYGRFMDWMNKMCDGHP